jgi:DNA repair exonuclease SbcCD ATPase subunit
MNSNLSKLLESAVLNEETKTAILEAWDNKLSEAREELSAELREEFASRYDHDKTRMIEATEIMVRDALKEEFEEFAEDKKRLREARVQQEAINSKLAEKVLTFTKDAIVEEIKEFKTERKQVNESLMKLQKFVKGQLTEELAEFSKDKNALIEERINFEKTKTKKITEAKKRFVETASKISEKVIREALTSELKQLREDLKESKKRMFGAKLFEAFASEYMNSHYNEGSQVKQLGSLITKAKNKINELKESVETQSHLIEAAKTEANRQKALRERAEVMSDLLSPLNKDQRKVMKKLLEHTATNKLNESYKQYIPMVLKEDVSMDRSVLKESSAKVEYDGNRVSHKEEDDTFSQRLKVLSGIK